MEVSFRVLLVCRPLRNEISYLGSFTLEKSKANFAAMADAQSNVATSLTGLMRVSLFLAMKLVS